MPTGRIHPLSRGRLKAGLRTNATATAPMHGSKRAPSPEPPASFLREIRYNIANQPEAGIILEGEDGLGMKLHRGECELDVLDGHDDAAVALGRDPEDRR